MSAHTPGPWKAILSRDDVKHDGWPVVVFTDWVVMSAPCKADTYGSQEADARLISAAPEMLEALKLAQVHLECAGITLGDVGYAIARAEGRES